MAGNGLPPESQVWARAIDTFRSETPERISTLESDVQAQIVALRAAMSLLPQRISELDAASKLLSIPVAETYVYYDNSLNTMPANTWQTRTTIPIVAPPGKASAQVAVVSTPFVRRTNQTNVVSYRVKIDGTTSFTANVNLDSGFLVYSKSVSASTFFIDVDVMVQNPATINNDATYPNHFRNFVLAVWS